MSGVSALYKIEAERIPAQYNLSAEVLQLVQADYTGGYAFTEELELVRRQPDEATTPLSHSDGALNLNEGVDPGSVVAAPAGGDASRINGGSGASVNSSSDGSKPAAAVSQPAPPPLSQSAAAAAAAAAAEQARRDREALDRDQLVTAMMLQTGAEGREECLFYLESCNWDVARAVTMLTEFTRRD